MDLRVVGRVLLVVFAVLSGDPIAQGADFDDGARVAVEVGLPFSRADLQGGLRPSVGPIVETPQRLARLLRLGDCHDLVLWFRPAPGSDASTAFELDPGADPELAAWLAPWMDPLRALEVTVFIGEASDAKLLHEPLLRTQRIGGAVERWTRLRHPGSEHWLWYDEAFWRELPEVDRGASVVVPRAPTLPPPLATTQSFLDVLCARRSTQPPGPDQGNAIGSLLQAAVATRDSLNVDVISAAVERLLEQSRLASAIARLFADGDVAGLLALESRRRVDDPPRRAQDIQAQEALLAAPRRTVEPPLLHPTRTPLTEVGPVLATLDTPVPGLCTDDALRALLDHHRLRAAALAELGRHLMRAQPERRARAGELAHSALEARQRICAEHRPAPTFDDAFDELLELEPYRVHWRDWELSLRRGTAWEPLAPLATFVLDDPRLDHAASRLRHWWSGDHVDLARFHSEPVGEVFSLAVEIPSPEAQWIRLELEGDLDVAVELGDHLLLQRSLRGETLRCSLPLQAALNQVRLRLEPRRPDFQLRWLPLPRRLEGAIRTPRQVRDVLAPCVRIEHPGALEQDVFFLPDASHEDQPPGGARYVVDPVRPQRVDVWLRALPPAGGSADFRVVVASAPAQVVRARERAGWQWLRLPAPVSLSPGNHPVTITTTTPGAVFDAIAVLETGTVFPVPPDGRAPFFESTWRYDVLGRGQRLDLTTIRQSPDGLRRYELGESGTFRAYAWLSAARSTPTGAAHVEVRSGATVWRFLLPAESPTEEWIELGDLHLRSLEPVVVQVSGAAEPKFLTLVKQ